MRGTGWLQCVDLNLLLQLMYRFSNLQIVIERPSFAQIRQHLIRVLSIDNFQWDSCSDIQKPSSKYVESFCKCLTELLSKQGKFLASLEFDYDIGKPQSFFFRLASAAICYLDAKNPILTAHHFQCARQLLEQDHQLAVLETVTEHGIALLIGMGHLEKADRRVFTLEMIYARWENFLRQHDMLAQLPTRSEAQKALDNLLRLELVKDAGDAFHIERGVDSTMKSDTSNLLQPEYRAVHLNFAPRTLEGMLRNGSIKCSTLLKDGCTLKSASYYTRHQPMAADKYMNDKTYRGYHLKISTDCCSRSTENSPILYYVNQSSSILRKVRLGRPLDAALSDVDNTLQIQCQPKALVYQQKPLLRSGHTNLAAFARKNTKTLAHTISPSPFIYSGCRRERNLEPLRDFPVNRAPQPRSLRRSRAKGSPPFTDTAKSSYSFRKTNCNFTSSASKLEHDRNHASRIIVRFLRRICRLDDRVEKALLQCLQAQRDKKLERYPFVLTDNEQLRILQLYNPRLYGSHHCVSPFALSSKSMRSRVPQMEAQKRSRQSEILMRMRIDTERLNQTSRQKTQALIGMMTTHQNDYQRHVPELQLRPKTVLGREGC
ncbi:putative origin recognition complex subunit 4 [Plasmopara halstedii]